MDEPEDTDKRNKPVTERHSVTHLDTKMKQTNIEKQR